MDDQDEVKGGDNMPASFVGSVLSASLLKGPTEPYRPEVGSHRLLGQIDGSAEAANRPNNSRKRGPFRVLSQIGNKESYLYSILCSRKLPRLLLSTIVQGLKA